MPWPSETARPSGVADAAGLQANRAAASLRLVAKAEGGRTRLSDLAEGGGYRIKFPVPERGLEAVSDTGALEVAADEVLAANPEAPARFQAGEDKILNFLMGQVMKKTGGKASPPVVREILARKLRGG